MRTFVLHGDAQANALWAFLKANWRALAGQGRPLVVEVKEYKSKRSLEQNKRYWKLLQQIAEEAWLDGNQYGQDAWHEYFRQQFIGAIDLPKGGKVGISTTTLDVAEFQEYMTKVEVFASTQLGVTFGE